ncbi:hypothetical protein ARMGADRAFT_1069509, partial [Armillaria gallica]
MDVDAQNKKTRIRPSLSRVVLFLSQSLAATTASSFLRCIPPFHQLFPRLFKMILAFFLTPCGIFTVHSSRPKPRPQVQGLEIKTALTRRTLI